MNNQTEPADDGATPSTHLELLRLLEQHPDYSQRQLASALGVSLGKTHYLLKALLGKGWVKAQNFRRNDHKMVYLYVLTPQGVRHRFQLTQAFITRKEQEYQALKNQIAILRKELATHAETQESLAPNSHRTHT